MMNTVEPPITPSADSTNGEVGVPREDGGILLPNGRVQFGQGERALYFLSEDELAAQRAALPVPQVDEAQTQRKIEHDANVATVIQHIFDILQFKMMSTSNYSVSEISTFSVLAANLRYANTNRSNILFSRTCDNGVYTVSKGVTSERLARYCVDLVNENGEGCVHARILRGNSDDLTIDRKSDYIIEVTIDWAK